MDIETLYQEMLDQTTSPEMVKEANQFGTVPTGAYRLMIEKRELREAGEQSPWPGRMMVHAQSRVEGFETGRKGVVFFDLSPENHRTPNNKLDGPATLWGQAIKTLELTGQPNREVVERLDKYPFKAYIAESFKTPEGYRTPKTEEEKQSFIMKGYQARNFVRSLSRLN